MPLPSPGPSCLLQECWHRILSQCEPHLTAWHAQDFEFQSDRRARGGFSLVGLDYGHIPTRKWTELAKHKRHILCKARMSVAYTTRIEVALAHGRMEVNMGVNAFRLEFQIYSS